MICLQYLLNSIDRIEIHKGNSGSVLYGEDALGGVINIITDTPMTIDKNLTDRVNISLGSFNSKKATYSFHSQQDQFLLKNNIELFESDGYRDENQQRHTNINSRLLLEESKNWKWFFKLIVEHLVWSFNPFKKLNLPDITLRKVVNIVDKDDSLALRKGR